MSEREWAVIVASAILAAAQPANAQVAASAAPDAGQAGVPPSTETARNGLVLDDIVVTAQKREQSRQDVPISINAFNAEAIAALSAESIGDLDKFTPGLSINDTSVTQPSYTIRGVSTDDFGIGTEPSVGIFIDGVYSARSGGSLVFFNDVQRVEVLKGPQGTLFGRNTSAGAISIITNKPVDKVEAVGTFQLGNYGKVRGDATLNVPITDTLFLRVNGVFNRRNGYLHDAVTGEDREREHNWSGRAALRWAPSETNDVLLAYDHDDTNKDGPASVGIGIHALSQDPFGPFTNDVIGNKETRILNDVSLTIRQDIGNVTLTSISAYKKFETHNREDEDGTGDPTRYFDTENIEHNKSFYQELRLGYDSEKLNLIAGVSYFHERAQQTSAATLLTDSVDRLVGAATGGEFPIFTILDSVGLPVFGLPFREDMNNRAANESYAAFADATYHVNDKFSVIAGLRYTHDDKKFTWENGGFISPGLEAITAPGALYNAILGADAFPADALISAADFYRATVGPNGLIFDEGALEGIPFTRHEKFNDVSPRFVLQYQLDEDKLLYASATRGYKAGGYNSTEINSFFKPENVWNFEGGFKTEWLDRRLRFNAAGYYFKYRNRQSISLESVAGSELPQYITRSGDSRAYGLDLETQFVVTRDLTISATAGAIDSKWVKRIERDIDIGHQPTGEPSFRGVLSAHYAHEIGNQGTIFADASYSYTSRIRLNDAVRDSDASIALGGANESQVDFSKLKKLRSPENVVNAKIGWRLPGNNLSISVYAENLFNDQRLRTLNTISADIFGTPYVRVDKPRFVGVEFGLRY